MFLREFVGKCKMFSPVFVGNRKMFAQSCSGPKKWTRKKIIQLNIFSKVDIGERFASSYFTKVDIYVNFSSFSFTKVDTFSERASEVSVLRFFLHELRFC